MPKTKEQDLPITKEEQLQGVTQEFSSVEIPGPVNQGSHFGSDYVKGITLVSDKDISVV